jgi:hypothetical protein
VVVSDAVIKMNTWIIEKKRGLTFQIFSSNIFSYKKNDFHIGFLLKSIAGRIRTGNKYSSGGEK